MRRVRDETVARFLSVAVGLLERERPVVVEVQLGGYCCICRWPGIPSTPPVRAHLESLRFREIELPLILQVKCNLMDQVFTKLLGLLGPVGDV